MRVLSYDEAASRANIVRRSLERLISRGEGPSIVHISARRRGVLESDLERWLLSRRRSVPGEDSLPKLTAQGAQEQSKGRKRF
jgi:predicted DNA-binding transcriptional regulator AlpA